MTTTPSRDELAERYLDQLPYDPYPVQEEALLAWFSADQGVLVCAPTGMGKTLIAEAALFEALHTGKTAYYTTPLIALTEQKFREMQELAVRWGFAATDVGLVTGNRRENPDARVLVVVAEILFNRLLHPEAFDFDRGRCRGDGRVPQLQRSRAGHRLGVLAGPAARARPHAAAFGHGGQLASNSSAGCKKSYNRRLELVQGDERKVPLTFQWVPDRLLSEQIEEMARGERRGPADARAGLLLQPRTVLDGGRTDQGQAGPGVGAAGPTGRAAQGVRLVARRRAEAAAAPAARRGRAPRGRVAQVSADRRGAVPAEAALGGHLHGDASAGINLPARSVVLPTILKGPPGKKKVMAPSSAHQIFGRAGRPQFDTQGYVFVLAHEDDVKIARWREQYDQIPEDTKDPGLLKAKKQLKKKMPKRRTTEQYWTEAQFDKLRAAPPGKLRSTGPLPWRLLAYMLDASPDVEILRRLVSKRLMDSKRLAKAQEALDAMLLTLWRAGYVTLEPEPPKADAPNRPKRPRRSRPKKSTTQRLLEEALAASGQIQPVAPDRPMRPPPYQAQLARPTDKLQQLLLLRGLNPLYGVFLVNQLGIADRDERIQAMESVLELPGSVAYTSASPTTTSCRPARWPRCGWTISSCDSAWSPPSSSSPRRHRSKTTAAALFDEERPLGADPGREAAPAVRLRFSRRPRRAHAGRLGGRRSARVRRRLQQVHHQQAAAEAGGRRLSAPAAADPAGRRTDPTLPARHDRGRVARRPQRYRPATDRQLPRGRPQQHREGARTGPAGRSGGAVT